MTQTPTSHSGCRLLRSAGPGGVLVRRWIPITIALPPLFAALRLATERSRILSPTWGAALVAVSVILLLWLLLYQTASALERLRTTQQDAFATLLRLDAERALEVARSAAKLDFLAAMSHELRTPLNAIAGHTQLLQMELHGPVTPAQTDALERIQRSQRHLLGLINDVLNFAKLEAGHFKYEISTVSVGTMVDSLEYLLRPLLVGKQLQLNRESCREAGSLSTRVRADFDKLEQILINLLSNAIKFTAPGGSITLVCRPHGPEWVRVAVQDTGVGIPAPKLATLFEPFVQVGRQYSAPVEGVGLGLAISRDLARGMGGDLTVTSAVGDGTTFVLTLPVA